MQKAGNNKNITVIEDYTTTGTTENIHEQLYWAEYKGSEITKIINEVYEKIVFWRRNVLMVPNGASGKNFI